MGLVSNESSFKNVSDWKKFSSVLNWFDYKTSKRKVSLKWLTSSVRRKKTQRNSSDRISLISWMRYMNQWRSLWRQWLPLVKVTPSIGSRNLMTHAFNGEQINVFVRWPKTFALGGIYLSAYKIINLQETSRTEFGQQMRSLANCPRTCLWIVF